jgi:hypothetical protein
MADSQSVPNKNTKNLPSVPKQGKYAPDARHTSLRFFMLLTNPLSLFQNLPNSKRHAEIYQLFFVPKTASRSSGTRPPQSEHTSTLTFAPIDQGPMTGEHAATPPRGAASKAAMPTSSSSEESNLKTVDIGPTKRIGKISPTNPSIKGVIDRSKQNAQRLITSSSHHIENNRWLLPVKFILSLPSHWPRTWSLIVGVLVPLWALICISMAFGSWLAELELPAEVERNDAILRARAMIAHYKINEIDLLNAPTVCLALWKLKVSGESVDGTIFLYETPISILTNETFLDITENEITAAFLNETDPDGDGFVLINQTLLQKSLAECAPIYSPMFDAYRTAQEENPEASDSLSFNWIRCWDSDKYGEPNRVFFPTKDQIDAAHPMNQSKAFQQEWQDMQQDFYADFLPENPTVEQESLAFERSLQGATGALVCDENMVSPIINHRF